MFKDRKEAGLLLAAKLKKFKGEPGVVLAVPRGGVPVAYEVAKELGFPIDVVLTKKIGHPANKEYAIGAASLTDYFIIPHENVSREYIDQELKDIRTRLRQMYHRFMGDREPESLEGKTVIVIDDGIATGNTVLATIQVLQKSHPAKIIIGAPVASDTAIRKIEKVANEVIVVHVPEKFYGVGSFYEDFDQVSDEEVMVYLDEWRALRKTG